MLLHEAGHAVSNLLRLPVLGREEDTADQIAAFIMLQFGPDIARTLVRGEAYGWNQRQRTQSRFWGIHSTALQRQHAVLCLAYGMRPAALRGFRDRSAGCRSSGPPTARTSTSAFSTHSARPSFPI